MQPRSFRAFRKKRILSVEGILVLLVLAATAFFSQSGMPDGKGANLDSSPEQKALKYDEGRFEYGGSVEKVRIPKDGKSIRFVHFNVCNYFVEEDEPRTVYPRKEKPEDSREAVASVLAESGADVIGLCEVGGRHALADLNGRLGKRGRHYPYSFVLERGGEDRALAVLSKYPIVKNESRGNVPVSEGNGKSMLRGLLDVTVELPDSRKFRMVGIHLKSKRDMEGTAETVRRREAYAVRLALNAILASQQGMPVLVFGDFNDGPSEPAVQIILGNRRGADGLARIKPRDSRGEHWTHFYKGGEEYLSYDHLLMNRTLRTRLGRAVNAGIIDIPDAEKAADHRAIWVDLK